MSKTNIVWLKRDLRLTDHEPLYRAVNSGHPVTLIYIFEPELISDPHYSTKHWRFVWQSLQDINQQLSRYQTKVLIFCDTARNVFEWLKKFYQIGSIYSHQEIGLNVTFYRDRQVAKWCQTHQINWFEYQQGGVIRGLKDRSKWDDAWMNYMKASLFSTDLTPEQFDSTKPYDHYVAALDERWKVPQQGVQTGGPTLARRTLDDFFRRRAPDYHRHISSPLLSRKSCSRLSPYLAWGNLSLREVYQESLKHWNTPGLRRAMRAFVSRLHWHCHFIQKFESECEMEFRPVNRAYENYPYENNSHLIRAWKMGQTGIPLVDACMRCLIATGYINFRMRAMLVSVFTHHMNLPWNECTAYLTQLFLDFEPGIHYPQIQMQASVTGANTIRIYNPTKQAMEKDPDGEFIYRWVPELAAIPVPLVFEPWKLTEMEAMMYQVPDDSVYLNPVIDLDEQAKLARDRLWGFRKRDDVRREKARILATHVRQKNR